MATSVFDLFRVGLGPSSSHTVGPMRAALAFVEKLKQKKLLDQVSTLEVRLMGSLAATGKGHGTDLAVKLGLMGYAPEDVPLQKIPVWMKEIEQTHQLLLGKTQKIEFFPNKDILFEPDTVPQFHTNALEISVFKGETLLFKERYYSVGGGFIVLAKAENPEEIIVPKLIAKGKSEQPYPYHCADELLKMAKKANLSIAQLVRANERVDRTDEEIDEGFDMIWSVMHACMKRGLETEGVLPGPFKIQRRAKRLAQTLEGRSLEVDPLSVIDWVNVWAFAVNEENAAGSRVVTAPTNGAAGVIPAVIKYFLTFSGENTPEEIRNFLLTAGAIGLLYKENASISGAEVGCQGEVGVACSMAAAGLVAVRGGSNEQIENAAEIGMEHNLGLTCDPVGGQVQIPCIERNAVAAVKAINAARLALNGDGTHQVSLDKVIRTMLETGRDMKTKYKETSRGGLAVCFVEC